MTSAELLCTLRSKGYTVGLDGAELAVSGPPPRDPEGAAALLREHRDDLLRLLRIEAAARQHRAVADVMDIFPGSRLVAARAPGGEEWRT